LARAIADCPIPVISAVGHETDFTICDFVSDMRAPTPSAAAELAAPSADMLANTVSSCKERMEASLSGKIDKLSDRVRYCAENRMLSSPLEAINEKETLFLHKKELFHVSAERYLKDRQLKLGNFAEKLEVLSPLSVLKRGYAAVFDAENKVVSSVQNIQNGEILSMQFADGRTKVQVLQSEREDTFSE